MQPFHHLLHQGYAMGIPGVQVTTEQHRTAMVQQFRFQLPQLRCKFAIADEIDAVDVGGEEGLRSPLDWIFSE